jgi:hypothetical protein
MQGFLNREDVMESKNIIDFFDKLIEDKTDKIIVEMILSGIQEKDIIEHLLEAKGGKSK